MGSWVVLLQALLFVDANKPIVLIFPIRGLASFFPCNQVFCHGSCACWMWPWPPCVGPVQVAGCPSGGMDPRRHMLYFLWARHDHNKIAACGMIKVFWTELNWIDTPMMGMSLTMVVLVAAQILVPSQKIYFWFVILLMLSKAKNTNKQNCTI